MSPSAVYDNDNDKNNDKIALEGSVKNGVGTTAKALELTPLQAMGHRGHSLKGYPKFTSHAEKRQWQLEHMAGAFRVFDQLGYADGISGHISVRDPEREDAFWINPLAVHFGLLKASDMVLMDLEGNVIGGNTSEPVNAAGFSIHSAVHRARPDVHAICHTHSTYGRAWSTFGLPLEMLNQDVCNFFGSQAVYDNYGGIAFGGTDEGTRIAQALGSNRAAILMNHGLLTVGTTVDEAAYLFTSLERCCQVQLLVESAGLKKRFVPNEEAAANAKVAGDPEALYCEFQPHLDYIDKLTGGDYKL